MLWHRQEGLLEYVDAAVTVPPGLGMAGSDSVGLLKPPAVHSWEEGLVVASVKPSLVSLYCRSIQVERWRHTEWSKSLCINVLHSEILNP